jgi:hypothetical protein
MARAAAAPRRARRAVVLAAACLAPSVPAAAHASLSFTRPDGSPIAFRGATRVWCGPWEQGVPRRSIHLARGRAGHHWELSAVRRDVAPGRRFAFPLDFVFDRPHGVQLFVADGADEASSSEEESSGSLTFSQASCHAGESVAFSVDAVLGSELFGGAPVHVTGTFRGPVSRRS